MDQKLPLINLASLPPTEGTVLAHRLHPRWSGVIPTRAGWTWLANASLATMIWVMAWPPDERPDNWRTSAWMRRADPITALGADPRDDHFA